MTEAKPLGKITAILADLGLEVTYAYDDLVFVQHSAFVLQFTDKQGTLKLFINQECNPAEANNVASTIVLEFYTAGFNITSVGRYTLSQGTDSALELQFV